MFVISKAMLDAGNRVVELATDAEIIQSFDGLGGGLAVAEAPPEIAQWFDCDREVSDIIFEAMDVLSEAPFGSPATPAMIVAGDRVMELLISARFLEIGVKADPALEAVLTEEIRPFVFNKEATVSLVYARMRAVGELNPAITSQQINLH